METKKTYDEIKSDLINQIDDAKINSETNYIAEYDARDEHNATIVLMLKEFEKYLSGKKHGEIVSFTFDVNEIPDNSEIIMYHNFTIDINDNVIVENEQDNEEIFEKFFVNLKNKSHQFYSKYPNIFIWLNSEQKPDTDFKNISNLLQNTEYFKELFENIKNNK